MTTVMHPSGFAVLQAPSPESTLTYTHAATGGMLGFAHVDRGLSLGLADALGRAMAGRDPLGFAGTAEYDAAHRPVAAMVVGSDGTAKVAGRSAWCDQGKASPQLNNAGKPLGGLGQSGWAGVCGFSLLGAPAATVAAYSRSYKPGPDGMPALDLPAVTEMSAKPAGLGLQAASYTAVLQHDAAGRPLESADPFGHVSQTHYRLSGVPDWVTVDGKPMLSDIRYNARGQTLSLAQGSFDDSGSSGAYHTLMRYAPKDLRMRQSYVTKSAAFAAAQTGETSVIDGSSDAGRLADSRHGFDPLGNVIEASGIWPDTVFGQTGTTAISRYRHDARYRLLAAGGLEGPAGSPIASKPMESPAANALSFESGWGSLTPYFQSYHYDPGGNLTALNHFANGAADSNRSASWQVSSGSNRAVSTNWYNSLSDESGTGSGNVPESFFTSSDNPLFDAGGQQLRTSDLSKIVWDWQGQVASISFTDPSNSEATVTEYYAYLPGGGIRSRKIRETANPSGNLTGLQVTEYFGETEKRAAYSQADASSPILYDGETVSNGETKTDYSTLRITLGHGQAARILSGKLSENGLANETRSWFDISDPIDSVQMELDSSGNIASYQSYYPYGGTAFAAQSADSLSLALKAYQYSGQEKDSSGLYFYGYRYYDSSNMRWTRPDPAGTSGSGFNWYAMVGGNPVSHRDVMGLATKEELLVAAYLWQFGKWFPQNIAALIIRYYFEKQRDKPIWFGRKRKKTFRKEGEDVIFFLEHHKHRVESMLLGDDFRRSGRIDTLFLEKSNIESGNKRNIKFDHKDGRLHKYLRNIGDLEYKIKMGKFEDPRVVKYRLLEPHKIIKRTGLRPAYRNNRVENIQDLIYMYLGINNMIQILKIKHGLNVVNLPKRYIRDVFLGNRDILTQVIYNLRKPIIRSIELTGNKLTEKNQEHNIESISLGVIVGALHIMYSKSGFQERFFKNPERLSPAFFGDYDLHEQLKKQAYTEKNITDIKYKIFMGKHSFNQFIKDFRIGDGKIHSNIRSFGIEGPYHIDEKGAQFYEIKLNNR